MGVRIHATRYTLNAHPDERSPNASRYNVHVEVRHNGLWAIVHLGYYLGRDGLWTMHDDPADWRPGRDAMPVARRAATTVDVNGRTAVECAAWEQSRKAVTR